MAPIGWVWVTLLTLGAYLFCVIVLYYLFYGVLNFSSGLGLKVILGWEW